MLAQKLVQLTMPGVPDVYQGSDLVDLSLVDPDNRGRSTGPPRERLARVAADAPTRDLDDEKLLVTSRTLRLRARTPGLRRPGTTATLASLDGPARRGLRS